MKERLIIKNFGPIKEADLTFGRFNVLIGEQATGKSTVAKLLAVCRYFSYLQKGSLIDAFFENGLSAWGLNDGTYDDTVIEYECRHYTFTATRSEYEDFEHDDEGNFYTIPFPYYDTKLIPKSEVFKALLDELSTIRPKPQGDYDFSGIGWRIPYSFFTNSVSNVLDNPFYLPTERGLQSIFSLGKSSIQNVSDILFNQFGKLDQIARLYKEETEIEPLSITYKNDNGHGFVRKHNEEKFFSLYNAASGYQSTIPIVLLTKYYTELRKKKKTIIIEEPELNLFPTAQNELMKFLVDKTMNYGNTMLIATHSPYVLTALNNLMYAFQVGQIHKEETKNVIGEKYWLNPDEVHVYRLMPDGTAVDIINKDLQQINVGELDEISRSINSIWDKIADIEFAKQDEN